MAGDDSFRGLHKAAFFCLLMGLVGSGQAGTLGISEEVDEVFQFTLAPAAITAVSGGDWLVALDQREKPLMRAVKLLKSGEVVPFPDQPMSMAEPASALPLDALEAVKIGADGVAWMLDTGRRSETTPKLVGWELGKGRLHRVIHLPTPATVTGSYCGDLALDPSAPMAYVSDPANGQDAALIVVDLASGLCRRVLQGAACLRPDAAVPLPPSAVSGRAIRRLDGTTVVPRCGVESLCIDRKGEWLYLAALQSRAVHRVPCAKLREASVKAEELAAAVERYAEAPPVLSLAIDVKGNLYVGDPVGRSIGIIEVKERQYRPLVADARLLWPEGLTFGNDGKLYFFSPAKSPSTLGAGRAPISLFRTRTPASGRAGD